jgi:hypothetical protein
LNETSSIFSWHKEKAYAIDKGKVVPVLN